MAIIRCMLLMVLVGCALPSSVFAQVHDDFCLKQVKDSDAFAQSDRQISEESCQFSKTESSEQIQIEKQKVSSCVYCATRSRKLWQEYHARSSALCQKMGAESLASATKDSEQAESYSAVKKLLDSAATEKESLLKLLAEIEDHAKNCEEVSTKMLNTYELEKRNLQSSR